MTQLTDTLWLLTGASGGIGAAMARILASGGARLALSGRRATELAALAEECRGLGSPEALPFPADLDDPDQISGLVRGVNDTMGRPDGLINNAGFSSSGPVHETPFDIQRAQIRVNICAPMLLTRALAPAMVENGRGWVLNVASIAGFQAVPGQAVYAATKAWMVSFSSALRQELASTGVNVTALCPGLTRTGFFDTAEIDLDRRFARWGTWQTPEPVARVGIEGVLKNKRIAVPGLANRSLTTLQRLMPRGMVTAGSRTSSAIFTMSSKPMKA